MQNRSIQPHHVVHGRHRVVRSVLAKQYLRRVDNQSQSRFKVIQKVFVLTPLSAEVELQSFCVGMFQPGDALVEKTVEVPWCELEPASL